MTLDVPYKECFYQAGAYYGVSPELLIAIAKVESGFNPKALNKNRNGTVDRGIMQINTSWDGYLRKHGINPAYVWDACYNIHVGAMILRHCQNIFGYTWKAVDCYNKGLRARESSHYVWKVYRSLMQVSGRF